MSHLTHLDKLLNGVDFEWKLLGEICEVGDGNHSSKYPRSDEMVEQGIPFIRGTNMVNGTVSAEGMKFITQEKHQDLRKGHLKAYDVLITNRGEVGKIAQVPKQFADSNLNSQLAWLRANQEILLPRYLFYVLNTLHVQSSISGEGGALQQLTIKNIKLIKTPIPCPDNTKKSLEIQAEIVRILDAFTELTAELTAELVARKQQYSYYREHLLTFEEGNIEWKALGEVAVIGTGTHNTQDAIDEGEYIFYARGREPLKLDVFDFDETAIITAGDGAGVGKVFHYTKGKYALHQRAYRIVPGTLMEPRFLYHYIMSYFYRYIQKVSVNSSVASLRRPMLLNFPIPILPLTEQERIVAILDKFDTLTTSLTEGLPREIALRQQQYEYYRELLLSFPKAEVADHD